MGTWVSYKGDVLGNIKPSEHTFKWEFYAKRVLYEYLDFIYKGDVLGNIKPSEHTFKWEFYAKSLEALQTLFSLPPDAVLDIEGTPIIYREFREKHLSSISAFYPSFDDWLLKNINVRDIELDEEGKIEKILTPLTIS